MANISLALVGRNPGYNIFSKINWQGPDPVDSSNRSLCLSAVYYSARMNAEFATFESVLCNFKPADREEAFRFVLRIPAGHYIVNGDGFPVGPKFILDEVKKTVLENSSIEQYGSVYRFKAGTIRPEFPVQQLTDFLNSCQLRPLWGGAMVMHGDKNPVFVDADDSQIGLMMSKVALCRRLADFSEVNFGMFKPEAPVHFAFTDEELQAEPVVTVRVSDINGRQHARQLDSATPMTFTAQSYGYDQAAYTDPSITLDSREVLSAANSGKTLSPIPGIVSSLDISAGIVNIAFRPETRQKNYQITFEGLPKGTKADALYKLLRMNTPQGWQSVNGAILTFVGPDILAFENLGKGKDFVRQYFKLEANQDYTFEGGSLIADQITIVVKPIPKPEPVRGKGGAAGAPSAASVECKIVLPQSCGIKESKVVATMQGAAVESSSVHDVVFAEDTKNRTLSGSITLPSVKCSRLMIGVEIPALYEGQALYSQSSNCYVAEFSDAQRKGWFARLGEAMSFRHGKLMSGTFSAMRGFVIILAVLIVFVIGFITGLLLSDTVKNVFSRAGEVVENIADGAADIVPGADAPGAGDVQQSSEPADDAVIEEDKEVSDESGKELSGENGKVVDEGAASSGSESENSEVDINPQDDPNSEEHYSAQDPNTK